MSSARWDLRNATRGLGVEARRVMTGANSTRRAYRLSSAKFCKNRAGTKECRQKLPVEIIWAGIITATSPAVRPLDEPFFDLKHGIPTNFPADFSTITASGGVYPRCPQPYTPPINSPTPAAGS